MTTERKYPKSLLEDPILEATFEVRFKPAVDGVADLLPGSLYPLLKDHYERVETLPAGEIPRALRDQMPDAAYQGIKRLAGKGTFLNIGEHAISVGVLRPYWGWDRFRPLICKVCSAIGETNLVGEVERTSLRYQNILTTKENPNDISGLELQITVADYNLRDGGLRLRAEVERRECISVVQVAGAAKAAISIDGVKTSVDGLLLDIDTIKLGPLPTFWTGYQEIIESVHDVEKEVFFSLLKDETINQMKPVWE